MVGRIGLLRSQGVKGIGRIVVIVLGLDPVGRTGNVGNPGLVHNAFKILLGDLENIVGRTDVIIGESAEDFAVPFNAVDVNAQGPVSGVIGAHQMMPAGGQGLGRMFGLPAVVLDVDIDVRRNVVAAHRIHLVGIGFIDNGTVDFQHRVVFNPGFQGHAGGKIQAAVIAGIDVLVAAAGIVEIDPGTDLARHAVRRAPGIPRIILGGAVIAEGSAVQHLRLCTGRVFP